MMRRTKSAAPTPIRPQAAQQQDGTEDDTKFLVAATSFRMDMEDSVSESSSAAAAAAMLRRSASS